MVNLDVDIVELVMGRLLCQQPTRMTYGTRTGIVCCPQEQYPSKPRNERLGPCCGTIRDMLETFCVEIRNSIVDIILIVKLELIWKRERERDRETHTETRTERERERDTERKRDYKRKTEILIDPSGDWCGQTGN